MITETLEIALCGSDTVSAVNGSCRIAAALSPGAQDIFLSRRTTLLPGVVAEHAPGSLAASLIPTW